MCCERLVCAACTGPVSEARCTVCRASRASVHGPGATRWADAAQLVLLVLAALALLALLTS